MDFESIPKDITGTWKKLSVVFLVLFGILFIFPYLVIYQLISWAVWDEAHLTQAEPAPVVEIMSAICLVVVFVVIINFAFTVAPNRRTLLLSRIFTPIQTVASFLGFFLVINEVIWYFFFPQLALFVISIMQLAEIYRIRQHGKEYYMKTMKLARVLTMLTCILMCFTWVTSLAEYIPYAAFIILTTNAVANFLLPKRRPLLTMLGICQSMILGMTVLIQFGWLFKWWYALRGLDIPWWFFVMSIGAFLLSLAYLVLILFEKRIKIPRKSLYLKLMPLGCWLLTVIPYFISIKGIIARISDSISKSETPYVHYLNIVLIGAIFFLSLFIILAKRNRPISIILAGLFSGLVFTECFFFLFKPIYSGPFNDSVYITISLFVNIVASALALAGVVVRALIPGEKKGEIISAPENYPA